MKAKKILSGFLALLMILTAVPLAFAAEDYFETGVIDKNISYTFDYETGKLSFYGEGKLNIPIYNREPWMTYLEIVQEVDIGEGITGIASYAFSFYRAMTTLKLPETLKNIGSDAFLRCSSLTSLVIPASCERISSHAFNGCTSLKELDIRDGLVEIEDLAFMNCSSLKEVVIPRSVRKIGNHSFFNSALEEITVLSDNISIDEHGLGYCAGIEGVDEKEHPLNVSVGPCAKNSDCVIKGFANSDTEAYADENGLSFEAFDESYPRPCGENAFYTFDTETGTLAITGEGLINGMSMMSDFWHGIEPEAIKHVTINDGITEIAGMTFSGCVNIETVELPQTLEKIGTLAFNTFKLKEITIPASVKKIDSYAFYSCSAIEKLIIEGDTDICFSFYNCASLKEVELKNVAKISDGAFLYCTSLENVVMPDTVKEIGTYAFAFCFNLKNTDLGSVEKIGEGAFYCDINLENIVIPESVKSIGKEAFFGVKEGEITICTENAEFSENAVGYSMSSLGREHLDILVQIAEIEKEFALELKKCEPGNYDKANEILAQSEPLYEKLETFDTSLFLYEEEHPDESEEINVKYFLNNLYIPEKNDGYTINTSDDATAHVYAKTNGINHTIIGSTCDDTCGVHNIYTNDIMEPSCTENGYKGGKVCLDCEKIFEAATIIPPKGHTETIQPGFAPTCTEPGLTDTKVCAVCGDVLEDVRLIQPKGHTDNDNNGICDECGDKIEGYEPEEVPETITQKIINFFKGIVDAILALFRRLFG